MSGQSTENPLDAFSREMTGKPLADLTREERQALQRHPAWLGIAYGMGQQRMNDLLLLDYSSDHLPPGDNTPEQKEMIGRVTEMFRQFHAAYPEFKALFPQSPAPVQERHNHGLQNAWVRAAELRMKEKDHE